MTSIIKSLLRRGDYVAVEAGRLVITPQSGKPIPKCWAKQNLPLIMADIAATTDISIFQYQRFVAKKFGVQRREGVMLDYVNVGTGESVQVFYNAELTRDRTTKTGNKGDPLPSGKFRVTQNHAFTKFWIRLGLPLPRRLSEFHDCMGKLSSVFVTVSKDAQGKIDKSTMKPVSLSSAELREMFLINRQATDNSSAVFQQQADNYPTELPGKQTGQTQLRRDFQANFGTSKTSTYLSNQVGACNVMPLDKLSIGNRVNNLVACNKRLQDQTTDEWLEPYNRAANKKF